MHTDCFRCDLKQMTKISHFLSLDKNTENVLIQKTQEYLEQCDMKKTNPEIMANI